METQANPQDDEMPAEIDFSKGTRGKFFQATTRLNLPIFLETEIQTYLTARRNVSMTLRHPGILI